MSEVLCPWPEASAHPMLVEGEVHVWCASLDRPEAAFAHLLAADERARAGRLRFDQDRRRYTVGRGVLRLLLGRYLSSPPEAMRFAYSSTGKPNLAMESTLRFNVAHSGELALYAITQGKEIGVDLEQMRPVPNFQHLVEQYFSPLEKAELETLPAEKKLEAFFCGWTRKEAYLKARGEGLTFPLDQFSVWMSPEKPGRLREVHGAPDEVLRWSFEQVSPARGFVGTLVVDGPLRCRLIKTDQHNT